ncbi:hypothetical protein ABH920_007353 [Catenulispora sp. EB89]
MVVAVVVAVAVAMAVGSLARVLFLGYAECGGVSPYASLMWPP